MDKGFRRQTKLLKFKVELCLVFKTLIISFIVISIYEDAVFCILFLCQQRRSDESLIKSWWNWVVTDNYIAKVRVCTSTPYLILRIWPFKDNKQCGLLHNANTYLRWRESCRNLSCDITVPALCKLMMQSWLLWNWLS